jgi:TRAP-type C4-dicarboxylate transport system permease small subunit
MGRWIALFLLCLLSLGFGAASLCGAAFTLMALPDVTRSGVENYAGAALIFSVPSLLIGGGLCWLAVRFLIKLWRNPAEPSKEPPP